MALSCRKRILVRTAIVGSGKNAEVFENARVYDNADIYESRVFGNAQIGGDVRVFGGALVLGTAKFDGHQKINGGYFVCPPRTWKDNFQMRYIYGLGKWM